MSNPHDEDPFAENPEAEFAPTQAMTAIPVAGDDPRMPGGAPPGAAAPGPGPRPGAPGMGPRPGAAPPRAPQPVPERRIGPSAILAAVGGFLVLLSFFLPAYQAAFWLRDGLDGAAILGPAMVLEAEDAPEGMEEEWEASRALFEAIGFDDLWETSMSGDSDDFERAYAEHQLSPYQFMRFWQIADFNSDIFEIKGDNKVVARGMWIGLIWMALVGVIAILLAAVRGFRPMNALQVAWSGLFGLLYLFTAIIMLANPGDAEKIGEYSVHPFGGAGVAVLLVGSLVLWISAFVGLSKTNWWKAPLIGLGILVVVGALSALPVFLAST